MEKYDKIFINNVIDQTKVNIAKQYSEYKQKNIYMMIPVNLDENAMKIAIGDISFANIEVLTGKLLIKYGNNVEVVKTLISKLSSYIYDTESKIILLTISKGNVSTYIGLFLLDENYKVIS